MAERGTVRRITYDPFVKTWLVRRAGRKLGPVRFDVRKQPFKPLPLKFWIAYKIVEVCR